MFLFVFLIAGLFVDVHSKYDEYVNSKNIIYACIFFATELNLLEL